MSTSKKKSSEAPTASKKGAPPQKAAAAAAPTTYDPARGKAAFDSLARERKALDLKALVSQSTDIEQAAIAALGASKIASGASVRARLAALPANEFDIAQLERLENLGWATWYAAQQARTSRGTESKATLPADLVQRAVEIEARMQALCEYRFNADPEVGPKVAFLRPGSGYRDLANDLIGYAEIYEARPAEVASDTLHYRSTDREDAIATAEQIIERLGSGSSKEARARASDFSRSWTLLVGVYEDVGTTLRWLFRKDPAMLEKIPASLFTAGRSAPRPKKSSKKATATT